MSKRFCGICVGTREDYSGWFTVLSAHFVLVTDDEEVRLYPFGLAAVSSQSRPNLLVAVFFGARSSEHRSISCAENCGYTNDFEPHVFAITCCCRFRIIPAIRLVTYSGMFITVTGLILHGGSAAAAPPKKLRTKTLPPPALHFPLGIQENSIHYINFMKKTKNLLFN
uniref:(northern house mosquito) hypothetical protein n=1 Tax=Culex pipiens TaxID=7175 RepID=A0A8D8JXI5_CULPI